MLLLPRCALLHESEAEAAMREDMLRLGLEPDEGSGKALKPQHKLSNAQNRPPRYTSRYSLGMVMFTQNASLVWLVCQIYPKIPPNRWAL